MKNIPFQNAQKKGTLFFEGPKKYNLYIFFSIFHLKKSRLWVSVHFLMIESNFQKFLKNSKNWTLQSQYTDFGTSKSTKIEYFELFS